MSLSHRKADKDAEAKFEYYADYKECMSKSFTYGTFTLVSSASAIGLGQQLIKKHLAFGSPGAALIAPVVGGSIVSWIVTSRKAQMCQNAWMAQEEKHTAITPITEHTSDGNFTQDTK